MSRAKISAPLQGLRALLLQQLLGEPLDDGGLADSRLAHEHRVVLAATAQDLERAAHLADATDDRVELALASPLGQVRGEGGQRVPRGAAAFLALGGGRPPRLALAGPVPRRRLAHAVRDEVEDVEPGHALPGEDLHRVGARLAHERGQHVPHPGLVLARALDVDDGGLQDPAEGERLLRRAARARGQLLHGLLEELGELVAQPRHVGSRRLQDLLAVGVVGGGEEEVLHGQVGVPPHHGLAGRHVEHALQGRVEHLRPPRFPRGGGSPRRGPSRAPWRPWSPPPRTCTPRRSRGPGCALPS